MKYITSVFLVYFSLLLNAQVNMKFTKTSIDGILKGNYNPFTYYSSLQISNKNDIINSLINEINNDSILSYLYQLESFYTRNTGSDTVSNNRGIGAARRWAFQKLESFKKTSSLQTSYFQFDKTICSITQHRNILATLPGIDTSLKEVCLVEAHIDSRCESSCDTNCFASGMEDNGSGVALVLELARIMSKYNYKRTIVFLLTVGEEQSLDGSGAFAQYCSDQKINIYSVLNNDIVGGVICGKTASPPGCPGENEIDSLNVRLFSFGNNASLHKGFARFIKLEYEEEAMPKLNIKSTINIMNAEDRTGRGGDHIPFRQKNYTAIRLTSANEHGDANPLAGYTDRQHSTRDVLGKDINGDNKIDSFYVNVDYLKRNTIINGNALSLVANGPLKPSFTFINDGNGVSININSLKPYPFYRIGFRYRKNDFDTIITSSTNEYRAFHIRKDSIYFVSVCAVDENGIESLFSNEQYIKVVNSPNLNNSETFNNLNIKLLTIIPNPFDETTTFSIIANKNMVGKNAEILITDVTGKNIISLKQTLQDGFNEILFEPNEPKGKLYFATLKVEGKVMETVKIYFK
jgi:hypothetical protein